MIKTEYYKDLTKYNTFGMKVKARAFVEYDSIADFVELDLEGLPRPVMHIGSGSNLLFTDDFKGTVIHSGIRFIEPLDGNEEMLQEETGKVAVTVGAGTVFDEFCAWAASKGLWGAENLSGIPGEAGAAAVQNIGAYGAEVKDIIRTVYCYDLEEEEFVHFDVSECNYGYRDSIFKHPGFKGRYIVTHVVFVLSSVPEPRLDYGHLKEAVEAAVKPGEEITLAIVRKTVLDIRGRKLPDPAVIGSAGSFFKNPVITLEHFATISAAAKEQYGPSFEVPHYIVSSADGQTPDMVKVPAAWMIEQCGWKGKRQGGAAVYDKQPLVLVNYTGNAFPEEIIGLEKRIVASVKEKFGVELHPEVEII